MSELHEAAAVAAFGELVVGRLGPGQIVVSCDSAAIAERLSGARFTLRPQRSPARISATGTARGRRRERLPIRGFERPNPFDDDDFDEDDFAEDDFDEHEDFAGLGPLLSHALTLGRPMQTLVDRIEAARQAGFAREAARALDRPMPRSDARSAPSGEEGPRAAETERIRPARLHDGEDAFEDFDLGLNEKTLGEANEVVARLFSIVRDDVLRWLDGLPPEAAAVGRRALDYPLIWAPIVALKPAYSSRALSRSRSLYDAIAEATHLAGGSRMLRDGAALLRGLPRSTPFVLQQAVGDLENPNDPPAVLPMLPKRPLVAPLTRPAGSGKTAPAPHSLEVIQSTLGKAIQEGSTVRLTWVGHEGGRERTVRVEAVRNQGSERLALVADSATGEGHAIRLADIVRVDA